MSFYHLFFKYFISQHVVVAFVFFFSGVNESYHNLLFYVLLVNPNWNKWIVIIIQLVLRMPKRSEYVKVFKVTEGN